MDGIVCILQGSVNAQRGVRGTNFGNGEIGGNRQFAQSSNGLVQNRPIPNGFVEGQNGGFIERPNGAIIERPNGANIGRPVGASIGRTNGAIIERPIGANIGKLNGGINERPNGAFIERPNNFVQNGRVVAPNTLGQPGVAYGSNTSRAGGFVQPVAGRMNFPN